MFDEIDIDSLTPMERIQLEFYLQALIHISSACDQIDDIHAKIVGDEYNKKEPVDRLCSLSNQIETYKDLYTDELIKSQKLLSEIQESRKRASRE